MQRSTQTLQQDRGDQAEDRIVQFLEANGYTILVRNFFCRYGEVDIIAEKDETICFIEVRMRSVDTWGDPSETVSAGKQRKIVKTAMHYMFRNSFDKMIRFDVIGVIGRGRGARIEHIPDAFDAGM